MIVVSDTSPLNYLILIKAIDVLPALFKEVYAPQEVLTELQRSQAPQDVRAWADSPPTWLHVRTPSTIVPSTRRLDPGEAQAIALAKELKAHIVLIDERKGRSVAKQEGLDAVGTITVLELAAEKKLLELETVLDALKRTTFRISDRHLEAALERDSARKLAERKA